MTRSDDIRRMLLISNSTLHGSGYLDHAEQEIRELVGKRTAVIFVPFADGRPSGPPADVLTGFLKDGNALGRPVGVAVDKSGALLVADDVGNTIWRVTPADKSARASR